MAQIEFQGKDLEEAIALAAAALSLPPEKVKFSVLTMGAKGFLGLGRRKAKIAVDPDDPSLSEEEKLSPQAGESKAQNPKRSRKDSPPRKKKPSEEKAPPSRADSEAGGGDSVKIVAAKDLTWAHVPPPLSRAAPGENEEPADQLALEAAEVARVIIKEMGFKAEIEARRIGPRVLLSLQSDDNALLIGTRGATLEALQLLTGKIVSKKLKDAGAESVQVVVDAADYRFRRQETLLENLKSAAQEARRSHKPQTLIGLSSTERRLVQQALRPFKDLSASPAAANRSALVIEAAGPRPRHRSRRRQQNWHQK